MLDLLIYLLIAVAAFFVFMQGFQLCRIEILQV